jgi:large subunit ribosomal protein L3
MKAILGLKKGMTRVYVDDKSIPVTIVSTEGCVVAATSKDGVELGLGKTKSTKSLLGKYKALGFVPKYRKMVPTLDGEYKISDLVKPEDFAINDEVTVFGTAKGKGFAGVVKRYGFHGGPKTHGQSDRWRAPGSVGAGTSPGRVFKGERMAGRKGGNNITLADRKVVQIIDTYILIKGAVPGNNGDLVVISKD